MRYRLFILMVSLFTFMSAQASPPQTKRLPQFSNDKVIVWKTVIYPHAAQVLEMHRHEHDRVLVALTDGLLKVTNNKGKVNYLNLKKDKAFFLAKNSPGEMHKDQNMSDHPIKVMVIELV